MPYTLEYGRGAQRDIRAIRDTRLKTRIEDSLLALRHDPAPHGATRLRGHRGLWRVRVGDWRICYRIEEGRLVILIIAVAPRGSVYGLVERRADREGGP